MGFLKALKEKLFGKNIEQKEKYVQGMDKSHKNFKDRVNEIFARYRQVDEAYFSSLEDLLIESDVGAALSVEIIDATKYTARLNKVTDPHAILEIMFEKIITMYEGNDQPITSINYAKEGPTVLLMVGVNGVGKTTTVAKLTRMFQNESKKVLWVAGDTFRAGAVEQLSVWGDRLGVEVVSGKINGDSASVIYDGVRKAKANQYDVVICDTAGRLPTKINLMNEIGKIRRVIQKEIVDGPHEVFLVLDATLGQNGIIQAKTFAETCGVTGIILTKMDGTSKGGVILAIKDQLNIPVRYIGLGEKMDDLILFDIKQYLSGLLGVEESEYK